MPTKSALQFRQREDKYIETEDGLNFKGWYHVDDIRRILWKKFTQLDHVAKKNTIKPFVFFDGLDQFTLEMMLNPLVIKLKNSSKKYFPFIFKPEIASVHYMAGFLRKNEDESVSIIFFNPTGTAPRVNYGDYAYKFRLMNVDPNKLIPDVVDDEDVFEENLLSEELSGDSQINSDEDELINFSEESDSEEEIEKNTLYFEINKNSLQYTVINPAGDTITNSFSKQDLNDLGIAIDLQTLLTLDIIREQLVPKTAEILKMTLARGHTEKKIEIISSSKKIQTSERDGGPLVSCGPLSLAFIEYLIMHPDYMENLDKGFQLPDFLDLEEHDNEGYRTLVTKLRQEHYQVLDTIEDTVLDLIDASYCKMTGYILDPKSQSPGVQPTPPEQEEQKSSPSKTNELDETRFEVKENHPDLKPEPEALKVDPETLKVDPETREDVQFVRSQIKRFRDNAKCYISFNNGMKADAIEQALNSALKDGVQDVRIDERVKDALAIHRIFSFFGCKSTTATAQLEESLANSHHKN